MGGQELSGSCLCGTVKFSVGGPWVRFMQCYCSRCRKATGSAHATNLFAHADNFRWTAGEENVGRYDVPSAGSFASGFCRHCGGKIPHRSRNGKVFVIPAGSLDQPPDIKPQARIFWGSRADWVCEGEELPRFEGSAQQT